jgi:hypothetical protein
VLKWGRNNKVQFRYKKEGNKSLTCLVDGPLINIHLLGELLATCLPVLGTGHRDPLTDSEQSRIVCKFSRNYNESLRSFHDFVIDCAGLIGGTPNSINFNYSLNAKLGDYLFLKQKKLVNISK